MRKTAAALILISVLVIAFTLSPLRSFLISPEKRTRTMVAQDIENLMVSGQVGDFWSSLKDIQLQFSDSSLFHYLNRDHLPVSLANDGKYELQIQVIRWIEGHRHGLVMDFEVFDTETDNKVSEFGRTYHVGYIW